MDHGMDHGMDHECKHCGGSLSAELLDGVWVVSLCDHCLEEAILAEADARLDSMACSVVEEARAWWNGGEA